MVGTNFAGFSPLGALKTTAETLQLGGVQEKRRNLFISHLSIFPP